MNQMVSTNVGLSEPFATRRIDWLEDTSQTARGMSPKIMAMKQTKEEPQPGHDSS